MIDPNKTYSLSEVVALGVLSSSKTFNAHRNVVVRDSVGANVLKAKFLGEGRSSRIYIEGKNLIKFLAH